MSQSLVRQSSEYRAAESRPSPNGPLGTPGPVGEPNIETASDAERVDVALLRTFDASAVSALLRDDAAYHTVKRIGDVLVASVLLVLLFPVMLLIAVCIRLETHGPVIFAQKRIGSRRWRYDGYAYWQQAEFTLYKFRSMVQDADPAPHQALIKALIEGEDVRASEVGPKFKLAADPRITAVGAFLRKTSLDELPQLFNVLEGTMSLVGPRPDLPYSVEIYKPGWHERLAALPGMTGLWQVNGRADVDIVDMVGLDLEYIRTQSLALDWKILLRTPLAVFEGKGAA